MRRNQITLIFILTGAVLWVGLTSWQRYLKTRSLEKTSAELVTPASAPDTFQSPVLPSPIVTTKVSKESEVGEIDPKELEFQMPDRETYRVQVIEREHQEGAGLPPILRQFSVRMAELMEKASLSPPFAAALFDRLKECSTTQRGETIHQARTICAVNAIRLGEIHPKTLGDKAKAFRESLPATVKTRVVALGF
jgi:hypothetical protein